MTTNNFLLYSTKILTEIIRDVVYFPVWWYSRGLVRTARGLKNFLINKERSLALFVWLKNIFRPMYGQRDWQGYLISFFIRLIQIIIRGFIMMLFVVFAFFIFCFWLILPFLVIYEIIFQIFL